MSTLGNPAPPKPVVFTVDGAPVGVEVKFIAFLSSRPLMPKGARLQLVHTNAASREGSIEASWNWSHAAPNVNTIPHYQVDRDGRARKMLPSNRVGIANATVDDVQGVEGDVRNWSLAYETADLGTIADPGLNQGFTDVQGETLATILAYESITCLIPLEEPAVWDGAGTACHTQPFGFPHWTIVSGKTCPGPGKKADVREWVVPRARQIKAAWLAPPPPLEDELANSDEILTELRALSKAFGTFRDREFARDLAAKERDELLRTLIERLDRQVS